MRRPRLCLAALAALAFAPASAAATAPRTFEVVARQGQEARAITSIHRLGGHVTLRRGRTLQVRLPLAQLTKMRRSAGVRGAGGRSRSAGPTRSSRRASTARAPTCCRRRACAATASGSRCSTSASARAGARRSAASCRPPAGIDAVQSFDQTTGQPEIAGLSSSDTPTSHGESVAEVVHDMAPDATPHARQLPHRARVRAGGRLADPRPGRQAARRRHRALEQLPGRPVRRHGRDRAERRRRTCGRDAVGQQRGQLRSAPLVRHRRRPRWRHLRRHDRPERPDLLDRPRTPAWARR